LSAIKLMHVACRSLLAVLLSFAAITAAGAQELTPWRHGVVQPKGDAGFWYMTAEGGFAKAQGLDLKMTAVNSDVLLLKALLAGELDTFEASPTSPMIASSKGADVKILGCTWPKLAYSFFSRNDVGSVADLRGRNIGISAPGSLPDLVARAMLRQAGLEPKDVNFVVAGSDAERIRAIVGKTIDAAISASDFAARPELGLKTLARANEVLPQFVRTCVITRGDLIRAKPDALASLLAAIMNAYGYAVIHRAEVIALALRVANLPPNDPTPAANFDEAIEQKEVSPTLEIDMAKFIWLRNLLAADDRLDAKADPAAMIDGSIRARALARVQPVTKY
jgi:NitT/TauT family transport system substrate-binding protein